MSIPAAELTGALEATVRLKALTAGIIDLRAPSLLPGWSRAHVIAHLVGNARSHIRMITAAHSQDLAEQYPGGAEARELEIKELAADPAEAVRELHRSADELAHTWRSTSDWTVPCQPLHGDLMPLERLAWARWREVEVHAVDLDAGYLPADWPQPFLTRLLDELRTRPDLPPLTGITGPDHALAAWLSGRSRGEGLHGDLPDLPAWR